MQQDIIKVAYCQNTMVEMDLLQLLKQQTTIRRHQAWTTQRRTKRTLQDLDDIEWRSTLSHVHSKRAVHTFFSSAQDTRNRTHRVKKLHGMLPTMNVMHARHPDLYPDQVCCVCEIQDEDNAHIWQCSANPNVHNEIWEEGLARIDGWGQIATSKYNKKAKENTSKPYSTARASHECPRKRSGGALTGRFTNEDCHPSVEHKHSYAVETTLTEKQTLSGESATFIVASRQSV